MNVISIDDSSSPRTFTVMFGGAESGLFDIHVSHKLKGPIETKALNFRVGAEVNSISTNVLSVHGGTLLKITGQNFGDKITDNPV